MIPPDKVCPVCGRSFAWRRRWAREWERVIYCSDACRGQGRAGDGAALEAAIVRLLGQRAAGRTICPSEVLPSDEKQDRARMEQVRAAARRLAHQGVIEVMQGGRRVDPDHARGPIRLRKR